MLRYLERRDRRRAARGSPAAADQLQLPRPGRPPTAEATARAGWTPTGELGPRRRPGPRHARSPRSSTSTRSPPTVPDGPGCSATWAYPAGVLTEAEVAASSPNCGSGRSTALADARGTPGRRRADPVRPRWCRSTRTQIDRSRARYPGAVRRLAAVAAAVRTAVPRTAGRAVGRRRTPCSWSSTCAAPSTSDACGRPRQALLDRHPNLRARSSTTTGGTAVQVDRTGTPSCRGRRST